MVPILMQQGLAVHAVVALARFPSARIIPGCHGSVTGRYQDRFAVQTEIGGRYPIAPLVILQLPRVVTVAMQDRLVVHAMVSHARHLALAIKGRTKDSYAAPKQGGFAIEPDVNGRGLVTALVVFRFHAVIAVLVQDRLAVRTMISGPGRPPERIVFVLRGIPTILDRHGFQVRTNRADFGHQAFVVIANDMPAVAG